MNLAASLYARSRSTIGQRKIAMGRAGLLRGKATGLGDDAAIALYQSGLATDPRNIYIRADLARALRDAGQPQQAAEVIAKGIELAPDDRQTLQTMANAVRIDPDPDRVQAEINAAKRASLRHFYQTANGGLDLPKPAKAIP